MPSVTIGPGDLNLQEDGPLVEVLFLISSELEERYRKEKKEIPEPVVVKALIDTGASMCLIQEDIPKKLGLEPVGTTKICTPSSKDHACYQYFMRMAIPSHNLTYHGVFIASPLQGQEIDCLIGRDLLKDGILIYLGNANQFTLSLL
ncbi:MAG: hypothetical protein KJ600_05225 [Nanoarchaeota archaeon]|nr:hypothetical protein [Nanoarchaeota archaeon]MBU1103931.1 hypothetical protein [Nanoarchaeota archaeon]